MIKVIISDMDGVLLDARDIHYHAMNKALREIAGDEYIINYQEHLAKYDGLSTKKKLKLLTKEKKLPEELYDKVWKLKQEHTTTVIRETINYKDHKDIVEVLLQLKKEGYKLYCASNSIRATMNMMLTCAGYFYLFDGTISNECVKHPKPHPEMYLRAILESGFSPKECLVIEDSHIGRKAAHESGAHVLGVRNKDDFTYNNISAAIQQANRTNSVKLFKPKWQGKDLNVLIPMAGAGSRFQAVGYTFPKPLIDVRGKTMVQMVVDNLNIDAKHIFIVQKEHYDKYNLQTVLNLVSKDCEIIQVDKLTEGAACTTLLAKEFINNSQPLLIANCDQYIEWDSNEFMYSVSNQNIDGGVLVFESSHPKWSYCKLDDNGFIVEVAEKRPISTCANIGVYYWNHGSDYVKYTEQMINKNVRVNNEFYVAPVYNEAILDNKKFRTFEVERMWGTGTPEDLQYFLNNYKGEI